MSYEPKIIAYLCTWCSYTGADTAGIARLKSPANLRAIRVPCSGRVSPEIIMRTFDQGADGVLVLGCHIGECHYDTGNHRTAKRLPVLHSLMAYAGLEPERLRLDWVSASEGERFARIANEFTEAVRSLGPSRWRAESRLMPAARSMNSDFARRSPHPAPSAAGGTDAEMTFALRASARDLLANQEVQCVIGYEVGPRGRTRPAFIYQAEDVDRLVWSQDCTHNLAGYLHAKLQPKKPTEAPKPVAVVVKPCDSRTLNVLVAENKIERHQVVAIGVTCQGVRQGAGFDSPAPGDGQILQDRCRRCNDRAPVVYDLLVGEQAPRIETGFVDQRQEWLERASPDERMEFWLSQFDRCIRCYACRQACPMCDCPTCLYERDDSLWVGMANRVDEKRAFHLGRAFHLAGRCVGCNECERVCPMGIPISLLNLRLAGEMQARFGHRAGQAAVPSPVVTVLSGEER
jgi:coenzyme F420-reducing hydrogenase delta subunit/ferredoxin